MEKIAIAKILIIENGQILIKYSHHLVTLVPTSSCLTYEPHGPYTGSQ